jgi:carboxymethylenebutenolidase
MIFPTELDATVMYYGQFVTDAAALQPVDVPILGIYGAADESNPARDVMAFRTLLTEQLHKNAKVLIYPNAKQAFASEGGANYNTEIAAQAWEETMTFLRDNLKARKPGQ